MRKSFLLAGFLLLTILSVAQSTVTLYDQCNYGGRNYSLAPGNYRSFQMKISNDRLASMRIPSGMKVTLYEHDNFTGRSTTYSSNISCLPSEWLNMASSLVVESEYAYNENDYVVFYNDCFGTGYSRTLRPGRYTGTELGNLKQNISSFTIYGNLRIKAYLNNENLSGYSVSLETSQSCLGSSQNDKIASLIIEYKPATYEPGSGSSGFVNFYVNCNYEGNSIRLGPGRYEGDKLGLFKHDISSVEIPSDLQARVYINSDFFTGTYYTLTENNSCLSSTMNNRINSIIIENRYGTGTNPGNNNQYVVLYADTYHQGHSASLLPGSYATMEDAGFINDALSSLIVPAGFRVVLYENVNFTGKSYTITQSKSMFTISGWNDKASSIKVYRN